jgi:HNH endonuclease
MINIKHLKSALSYDEKLGHLYWIKTGKRAGCEHSSGYRMIGIKGKKYKEHRIIWLFFYGQHPTFDVDHINRVKNDNRIINLRKANEMQNAQNMVKAQSHSKTGVLGVSPSKYGFVSSIQVNGIKKYLGRFKTIQEAEKVYLSAKKELHTFCVME